MTAVPPEAITAAALVLADVEGDDQTYRDLAYDVLTAAMPHLAAADPATESEGFRAYKAGAAAGRELLTEAADALWNCAKAVLTVKPTLNTPYPDAPEWTPYTRWVERPARHAHDLAMKIRKHLRTEDAP